MHYTWGLIVEVLWYQYASSTNTVTTKPLCSAHYHLLDVQCAHYPGTVTNYIFNKSFPP